MKSIIIELRVDGNREKDRQQERNNGYYIVYSIRSSLGWSGNDVGDLAEMREGLFNVDIKAVNALIRVLSLTTKNKLKLNIILWKNSTIWLKCILSFEICNCAGRILAEKCKTGLKFDLLCICE